MGRWQSIGSAYEGIDGFHLSRRKLRRENRKQEMSLFGLLLQLLSKTQYHNIGRVCLIVAVLWGLQLVESLNALERIHHVRSAGMTTKTRHCVHGRRITQRQKALKFPISHVAAMAMAMATTTTPLIHLEDLDRKQLQVCNGVVYTRLVPTPMWQEFF